MPLCQPCAENDHINCNVLAEKDRTDCDCECWGFEDNDDGEYDGWEA